MLSRVLRRILLPVVLISATLEVGARLWLVPAPDPATVRTATFNARYYEYDRDLVVRLQPQRRHDFSGIRDDLDVQATVNAQGFRGADDVAADPQALRVLVLGDSVTFGFGVADDEAWPQLMARLLTRRGKRIQVRNLAVPGYSTSQGRILFERHALGGDFRPHLVVFAFGFNDGYLRAGDDEQTRATERWRHEAWQGQVRTWLGEHSALCAWLWQGGQPQPLSCRVPEPMLRDNLEAVTRAAAARDIDLILVDASLPHCYPRDAIESIGRSHGCGTVAFRELFRRQLGLPDEGRWPAGGRVRITLPTHGMAVPADPSGGAPIELLCVTHAAARAEPLRIALHDDGTAGDATAADGVWSAVVDLPAGARPELGFRIPGLAARMPEMQRYELVLNGTHLQQPGPVPADSNGLATIVAVPNVCPWPNLMLVPDPIHPNALGHQVIAAAMVEAVIASRAWSRAG